MNLVIDGLDFNEAEAEKYWSFPKSYKNDKRSEAKSMIFSGEYIGARKMDGAYYRFVKSEDGEMRLQGRSRSVSGEFLNKIELVPHLHEFFNSLPNGTCLLGEIYFPNNEGSNKVTSVMGCLKDKAISRQKDNDKKLHYYIFDVWAWHGVSYANHPAEDRFKALKTLFTNINSQYNYVECADYKEGKELWDSLGEILSIGGEGVVITKKNSKYAPGKRTARKTLKIKKEISDTLDCIIIGANAPTKEYKGKDIESWKFWYNVNDHTKMEGQYYLDYSFNKMPIIPVTKNFYYGWAGSLKIGVMKDGKSYQIGSLSGLEESILANWKTLLGKVIEVSAMEIYPDTLALRHPKFIKFRDDLTKADATYEKLKEMV